MLSKAAFKKTDLLIRNSGWLLGGEVISKASRVIAIVALASALGLEEYGVMMLAVAAHEVIRWLLRSGAGPQIIQCDEALLPSYAANGVWVQWCFCLLLMLLQCGIGVLLGWFYQNPVLTELLMLFSLSYLFFPVVAVRVFLLQRANKMAIFSVRNGACIVIENLVLAAAAYAGAGIYAVVIGKVAFGVAWVVGFWRLPVPRFPARFDLAVCKTLLGSSGILAVSEVVRALRSQLDLFLAGKFLSPEIFGLYSFAKTAGVGLTQSLSQAFTSALYPYLCQRFRETAEQVNQAKRALVTRAYLVAAAVGGLFLLQSALVPVYVPLLFGERWQESYLTTALLCVLALPIILFDTHCALLRARKHLSEEMLCRGFCLFATVATVFIWQPASASSFAQAMLASSAIWFVCLLPWPKRTRVTQSVYSE